MPAGFPANILSATIYCQGLDVTVRGICVRQLLRRLLKRTHKQSPVVDHSAYVGFLYSIFFGRRPEKGVIEHWNSFLSKGLTYEQLFEALWRSEEFKGKAPYGVLIKSPPTAQADAAHSLLGLVSR
jgi:hypothetical protein